MRRGCIAVSEVQCDNCHRLLEHGERYLIIDGEDGQSKRFCVDCCLSQGYASHRMERGEKIIIFFTQG